MSEPYLSREKMAELRQLAGTDAGKQLLAYVQKNHGPDLRRAMEQAAAGNYQGAKQIAKQVLSSPEAADLLRKLGY